MRGIARTGLLILIALGCGDATNPSAGTMWDLTVVRHRVYDCDPDAFTVPFPSTPDAAICGSDRGLVSRSRDTLRARLTLQGIEEIDPPGDTVWTATASYETVECVVRPAPGGCEIEAGTAGGEFRRGGRVCPANPGPLTSAFCAGRAGQPYIAVAVLLLTADTIAVTAVMETLDAIEGADAGWHPGPRDTRLADTLGFRLAPVN